MQSTSVTYKSILEGDYSVNSKLTLPVIYHGQTQADTHTFDEQYIFSIKTKSALFQGGSLSIGNCCSREIDCVIDVSNIQYSVDIPRMAELRPYQQITNGNLTSEWLPKGVFYIDTRDYSKDGGKLMIHGYDAIMKLEADYAESNLQWPATDISVVNEIAASIGVDVDHRTTDAIKNGYAVGIPTNYTKREVLSYIAAMYAGNFVMSDAGKLLLVQIGELAETFYLVDENGNRLTIGGDRILVGEPS